MFLVALVLFIKQEDINSTAAAAASQWTVGANTVGGRSRSYSLMLLAHFTSRPCNCLLITSDMTVTLFAQYSQNTDKSKLEKSACYNGLWPKPKSQFEFSEV